MTINLSLTPDLEQFISQQVASGQYRRADDVVIDGLLMLRDRHQERQRKLEALRRDVDIGLEDSKAGRSTIFDENAAEEIKSAGRDRLKAKGVTPI